MFVRGASGKSEAPSLGQPLNALQGIFDPRAFCGLANNALRIGGGWCLSPTSAGFKKSPALCAELQILAENGGFEPPVRLISYNGFRDRRFRPLAQLSFTSAKIAKRV